MLDYGIQLHQKLRGVQPVPLASVAGTFDHGSSPNRRTYGYVAFGDPERLVVSPLQFDYRSKRWDVTPTMGVLHHCRVGSLVTTRWARQGHPNIDIYRANRWDLRKLTPTQQADDHARFRTTTEYLSTHTLFAQWYGQSDYVQVRGYGLYHWRTDTAKLGTTLFPSARLVLGCGVTAPPRGTNVVPYLFSAWVGVDHSVPRSLRTLDGDISFLAKG